MAQAEFQQVEPASQAVLERWLDGAEKDHQSSRITLFCMARRACWLKANRTSAGIAANNNENRSHCRKLPAARAGRRKCVRFEECAYRGKSDGVALQLGHEVVTGADAESHDGESGILAGFEVKPEASMTKRFLMSWVCWN